MDNCTILLLENNNPRYYIKHYQLAASQYGIYNGCGNLKVEPATALIHMLIYSFKLIGGTVQPNYTHAGGTLPRAFQVPSRSFWTLTGP